MFLQGILIACNKRLFDTAVEPDIFLFVKYAHFRKLRHKLAAAYLVDAQHIRQVPPVVVFLQIRQPSK